MNTPKLAGRHVGRIGALAVALGVGMAVAANTAVAEADTGSAKSPTTSSSDAGGSNTGTGKARSNVRPPKPGARPSALRTGSKVAAKPLAVNKVAGTARTPLIAAAPTAPTPRAVLLALAGWLRREYEYGVLGRRPVIMPSQLVASVTGPRVVQGTMNASGPNANLSYEVTAQPPGGIVTVDGNGQWTYTPVDGFPPEGGAAEFTVKVTDKTFHLANLFGAPAYTRTVTVPVSVPERAVAPDGVTVFKVYNFTQNSLTLHYPEPPAPSLGYPIDGTVYKPGEVAEFHISDPGSGSLGLGVNFVASTGQTYAAIMIATGFPGASPMAYAECSGSGGGGTCNSGWTNQVVLMDAPGTSITIPAAQTELVNLILNNVCTLASSSCTFKATNQVRAYNKGHTPSGYTVVTNDTQDDLTTNIDWSDSLATQTSWEVSAGASVELFKIVTAEVSSKYSHEVTQTHTFSQGITVTIRPGYKALLTVEDPVYRYTGDFTVSIGNTTWKLPGATLEFPDPTGTANADVTTVPKS